MTIDIATLTAELRAYAPVGVSLPRDDDGTERDSTLLRWAQDAAGVINAKRGKTTVLETTITIVENQELYDLPSGARGVVGIRRGTNAPQGTTKILDVPIQGTAFGFGQFGNLPSGQEVGGALDVINRQRLERVRREDDWDLLEGQIRFLFPMVEGEKIVVRYRIVDRDLASIPDDYFELLFTYMLWKNLDWFIERNAASVSMDADHFTESGGMSNLFRRRAQLERTWTAGINSIGQEAD